MRKVGCSNCVMWAKADSVVQDLMQLTSDVGVRFILTSCAFVARDSNNKY